MESKGQRSMFVRLMGMQLLSVCISLLIIGTIFGYLVQKYYSGVREWELVERGQRMVEVLVPDVVEQNIDLVRERIYTLAESSDIDLWVIGDDGNIVAGSQLAQGDPVLTLKDAEIDYVLSGNNLTKKMVGPDYQSLLVVLPIVERQTGEPHIIGALALRAPVGDVVGTVNNVIRLVLIAGLVAGFCVVILSFSMLKGFVRPLEQLKRATVDIAHGRFRQLGVPSHSNEVDHLVAAFNYASKQIEAAAKEQKELERLRKEFLSSVSHELRAPLTSLKGFLELIEEPITDEMRAKYFRIMRDDVNYLERLVNDVNELTKMESGQFRLNPKHVKAEKIVSRAVDSLELQFKEKGIEVKSDIQPNLPEVLVDPERMNQVMLNLLLNAVRFSPPGGQIAVRARAKGSHIQFEVEDHGSGIPSDELKYIWERFYKTDHARTRSYGGSGLGLAIVREIVLAHNGQVDVDSKVGQGTTFSVRLPL